MPLRLFNTYSREIEEFRPLDPDSRAVKMYTCGPTVYSHAHIGNFRAYIFEDLLQRHLEAHGYAVDRVMNLTDVDDKTIRGSRTENLPLGEFTAPFKEAFFQDLDTLQIKPANAYPAATEERYIQAMIAMIAKLIAARAGLPGGGQIGLLSDQSLSQIRSPGAFRFVGIAFHGPGKKRRLRQGTRGRFCALESVGRRGRRRLVG